MKVIAILPARMGSSRFPGKPLAPILGRPMIEHVYSRTAMSSSLDDVFVATCDEEIKSAVEGFGGKAVMTANTHERASDRIAEAAENTDADIVVLVQGDEPMTVPEMIDAAVAPMKVDESIQCVNLTKRIGNEADLLDPNTIKVVMNKGNDALFMSRQPIPTRPKGDFSAIQAFKQVCIMPFRKEILRRYAALDPTPLEIAESIDMMRFLEHGIPVRMVETEFDSQAVDTLEDLARVEELMRLDPLTATY
jgi:3-deoxy-manno-octulosonate cytidylyltransferase (CMP-KDO synthetase)